MRRDGALVTLISFAMASSRTQSATVTRFPVQRWGLDRSLARGAAFLIGPQATGGLPLAVGATWGGSRVNGTKDRSCAGLLCAGTNHGVCVSCDDGSSWQVLNLGLRDIPEHAEGIRLESDGTFGDRGVLS